MPSMIVPTVVIVPVFVPRATAVLPRCRNDILTKGDDLDNGLFEFLLHSFTSYWLLMAEEL